MSDACCSHDAPEAPGETQRNDEQQIRFWQSKEIRTALAAGVLLLAAFIAALSGGADWVTLPLEAAALLVAGWTFVPSAVRRLVNGKIGVGTLMTIAALGAVILGHASTARTPSALPE